MNGSPRIFLNHGRRCAPLLWAVAGGGAAVAVGGESQEKDSMTDNPHRMTRCEARQSTTGTTTTASPDKDPSSLHDEYPNFSRHGSKAVLPRLLTPQLYEELRNKKTPTFGVTLEDMISAGVMLPWGANPPRGIGGVYAGDADCYRVFAPLILPLVEECHGVQFLGSNQYHRGLFQRNTLRANPQRRQPSKLRRHQTNLDPEQILDTQIDPTGEYILYTRMRLARNIHDFPFCSMITRSERRRIEKIFQDIVEKDFRPVQGGAYFPIHKMNNQQHDDYMNRRMCFLDPDEYKLAAKLGRDWPDARGIYCSSHWDPMKRKPSPFWEIPAAEAEIDSWEENPPNVVMWCNYDDHFWIISVNKGGDVQKVFTCLSDAVRQLELSLMERNHNFVMDPKLGFLTSSPSNVGTALRASMSVKLPRLGREKSALFQEILQRLHLEAKSDYAETDQRYTGIFDIANAERLGRTEVQLINIMILGIKRLVELEKKLERGETVTLDDVEDVVKDVRVNGAAKI